MTEHEQKNNSILKHWLELGLCLTLATAVAYFGLRQNLRMAANDPQIQISEDVAAAIERGASPEKIINTQATTELNQSLSPLLVIFDSKGKVLASAVTIDSKPPTLPIGALEYAKTHGQNRITWQANNKLRLATVITPIKNKDGGYVVVAKSLRETENRIRMLGIQMVIGLGVGLLILLAFTHLMGKYKK